MWEVNGYPSIHPSVM